MRHRGRSAGGRGGSALRRLAGAPGGRQPAAARGAGWPFARPLRLRGGLLRLALGEPGLALLVALGLLRGSLLRRAGPCARRPRAGARSAPASLRRRRACGLRRASARAAALALGLLAAPSRCCLQRLALRLLTLLAVLLGLADQLRLGGLGAPAAAGARRRAGSRAAGRAVPQAESVRRGARQAEAGACGGAGVGAPAAAAPGPGLRGRPRARRAGAAGGGRGAGARRAERCPAGRRGRGRGRRRALPPRRFFFFLCRPNDGIVRNPRSPGPNAERTPSNHRTDAPSSDCDLSARARRRGACRGRRSRGGGRDAPCRARGASSTFARGPLK